MENFNQELNLSQPVYAGFWLRFGAMLIDFVILYIIQLIIITPVLTLMGLSAIMSEFGSEDLSDSEKLGYLLSFLPALMLTYMVLAIAGWLYYALMESSSRQGTLGKIAVGIKVTDYSGNRISFARATGRYFGKIVSSFIFCVGYIMAGFTEKKQALHDIMASCLVVRK